VLTRTTAEFRAASVVIAGELWAIFGRLTTRTAYEKAARRRP
jgi:hypothetical protein